MLKPRISPHSIFHVLFDSEMTKMSPDDLYIPYVSGSVVDALRKGYLIPDTLLSSPERNLMIEMPAIYIHTPIIHNNKQDTDGSASASKDNNNLKTKRIRLQYPIDEDVHHPMTDVLIRCGKESKVSQGNNKIFEIDSSQIEFIDGEIFDELVYEIAKDGLMKIGVSEDMIQRIKPRFLKIILQLADNALNESGTKQIYNEEMDETAFGFLMIQLPTTNHKRENTILRYAGDEIVMSVSENRAASYITWLGNANKIEFKPLESGMRAFLSFRLMVNDEKEELSKCITTSDTVIKEFNIFLRNFKAFKKSAVVKAYKKMIESKSHIYPVYPAHGFLLSRSKPPDNFNMTHFKFDKEEKQRMRVVKLMAMEAYGGLDKFEMAVFHMSISGQFPEPKVCFKTIFTYVPTKEELIFDYAPTRICVQSIGWLTQRIYPMQFLFERDIWNPKPLRDGTNEILFFYENWCVLMWPREVSKLIRTQYMIDKSTSNESLRNIALNASLFHCIPKDISLDSLKERIDTLSESIKDTIDDDSKKQIYTNIGLNYMVIPNNECNWFIETRLRSLNKKNLSQQVLFTAIKNQSIWFWFEAVEQLLYFLNGSKDYKAICENIPLNVVHLFSESVMEQFIKNEATEASNTFIGLISIVLQEYYKKFDCPNEMRLHIFELFSRFLLNHTWFDRFPLLEKKNSKLFDPAEYDYNYISSVGNIELILPLESSFEDESQHNIFTEKKIKALNWDIEVIDNYLGEDNNMLRLDYKVAQELVQFLSKESKMFPDSYVTSEISLFIAQFNYLSKKCDAEEAKYGNLRKFNYLDVFSDMT